MDSAHRQPYPLMLQLDPFEGRPAGRIFLRRHRRTEPYTKYAEPESDRLRADELGPIQPPTEVAASVERALRGQTRTRPTARRAFLTKLFRLAAEGHRMQCLNPDGTKSARPKPQAAPLKG